MRLNRNSHATSLQTRSIGGQTWNYIYEKDLLTKEKFSAHFFQNQCRDVDLIFAHVDLWEGIDRDTYNKNSLDFIRPGKLYEYSFADLKVRERHKSTELFSVIQSLELTGDAEPLSIKDNHDQYVACFGTNSAVFSWSSYFSNTVSDVVEVGAAYQAARAATAFINANKAAKKGELKKLLDFFRKYFNTQKLDDLINAIGNPNLKNFVVGLRTGDNFLIKQGEGAVNKLSIRTFHNNDFTELASIENNVLTIRKDGILDNGAEMATAQKLANDIEIRGANGENLSGKIEIATDDSGRGWFRVTKGSAIDASLERIRTSNPDMDIASFKADFGNDLDILTKFEKGELSVDSWNSFKKAGLDDLARNPIQLQKFDDLVKSNKLGLDAKGLEDLLSAPKAKGLKWDNPDGVLDAVKRASDKNISGLSISHKKFPEAGSDNFVLKNAKQYQAEASGDAALSFNKGGVSFDDIASDGKLVDRKYGHSSSIFDKVDDDLLTIYEVKNQSRAQSILDQAQRQLNAVGGDGAKLRWEISTSDGAGGIKQLFEANAGAISGIADIEVIYVAQKVIK